MVQPQLPRNGVTRGAVSFLSSHTQGGAGLIVPRNQKLTPSLLLKSSRVNAFYLLFIFVIFEPFLATSMAKVINLPLLQRSWEVANLMISLRWKPGQVRDVHAAFAIFQTEICLFCAVTDVW